jgi:pimeloyl-ACP methyl ester carboxylesterase
MATVALFHSALGLRRGVVGFADQLRAAGHEVHAIDSYDGEAFDDMGEGAAKRDALGVPGLIHTAQLALEGLAADIVYAGFSMGTGAAEVLAATRPGARGAVLMSGALGPDVAGIDSWPERVPVQVHYAVDDQLIDVSEIDALGVACGPPARASKSTPIRPRATSSPTQTFPTITARPLSSCSNEFSSSSGGSDEAPKLLRWQHGGGRRAIRPVLVTCAPQTAQATLGPVHPANLVSRALVPRGDQEPRSAPPPMPMGRTA